MGILETAVGIGLSLFGGAGKAATQQRLGPDNYLFTAKQMAEEAGDSQEELRRVAAIGEASRKEDTDNFYRDVLADYNIKDEAAFKDLANKLLQNA